SEPADRFLELPEDFRVVRIAEVQVVGRTQRQSAGTRQVARRFGYRDFAALIRIKINVSRVTIHRQRDELFRQGAVSIGERGRLTRNGWCRANRSVSGGSCGRQSTACCARSGWIPGR